MSTETTVVYYCENGSFGNCSEECTYNETDPKDAGANGKVFFCNNSAHVLKEDTKHDRTHNGTQESLALQGEFNFIDWKPNDNNNHKYENVAKMHRVKCATGDEEKTKCEKKDGQEFKLDKTRVVIEKVIPLKTYVEQVIEKGYTAKANQICIKKGMEHYNGILSTLRINFKMTLIKKLITAIENLHNLGYCHNDLKPGNIGVSGKNEIKFIDMGSATPIKKGTQAQAQTQAGGAQAQTQTKIEDLYTPNAKGFYLMRDTDLNKGGTFEYIPPMFSSWLGSLTHDMYRDQWSVGCIIYDIIKYNPDPDGKASTLFHHIIDPLLIGLEHVKMNQTVLDEKLNKAFSDDEKIEFKDEIEQMKTLMKPSLDEKYTLENNEAEVFENTYGIKDFETLKKTMNEENQKKLEEKKNKLEKEKTEEQKPEEVVLVNEPCVKLKKPDMYAQESISAQAPQKKGRFTICDVNGTQGGCKKRGGGPTNSTKIVPGVETDETGEYIYITNPLAYREFLLKKQQPQGQGGGKKKHNAGKLITKERYDKEKKKLSKNVSHVRKYNTSKGLVYYLFKKS